MVDGEKKESAFFYGWVVVIASFLLTSGFFALYSYGPFFKELEAEFGWSRAVTSSVVSVTSVVYCISGVLSGWLADKYGPRPVVVACAIFLGGGLVLSSQVRKFDLLTSICSSPRAVSHICCAGLTLIKQ